MSFPTKDTTFGTIIYKNNKYDLLTNPLSTKEYQKINKYKKENNCAIIMSPTGGNIFEWLINDDKSYLLFLQIIVPKVVSFVRKLINLTFQKNCSLSLFLFSLSLFYMLHH